MHITKIENYIVIER